MDKKISRLRRAVPTRRKIANSVCIVARYFARSCISTQTLFRRKATVFWSQHRLSSQKFANNWQDRPGVVATPPLRLW